MSQWAIEVRNLSKCYQIYDRPQDRLKQALFRGRKQFFRSFWPIQELSFDIHRGEVVGLIGANGSGKSTLLQMICGVLRPTAGTIHVHGRIAALLELGSGFNPEFTGRENLVLNATILGLTPEQITERTDAILAFADIGDFIEQPVKTYSSGMVVRLAFAISSFVDADVLVVDEALAVGDVGFQAKCLDRMEKLMAQGTTVILVAHDVQMIKKYCDRVLYLRAGQLVFDGSPEEGTERYLNECMERGVAGSAVSRKTTTESDALIRFGSDAGEILSVKLTAGSHHGEKVVVQQNERVTVDICARVDERVQHPRLQLTIRDHRGYNLYGFNERYGGGTLQRKDNGDLRVRYSFVASLQLGEYAITVRLDDCKSDVDCRLLDKCVGVATFVVNGDRNFDAVVDLQGRLEAYP